MIYQLAERCVEFRGQGQYVAPTATLVGSVILESDSSVWFGAVLRADNDVIHIGRGSNIQDGAVLHTDPGLQLHVGADVTVGHQAMLHGCWVGDGALIGIQAVILNGARIGAETLVGAHCLVPEGMEIPEGVLVLGSPAKIRRELSPDERARLREGALHYRQKAALYRASLRPQS